eukprot:TRINITY_DN20952_c0_g1_i7.p1 TRINITY_DN20952_c0_g1~~TRINITY_DN20952_c0_g1_i7.p1  ORF type:complete len:576 (+),score=45.61 TRINITY_DN20952_c0_g1_i7:73-1728(+)
MMMNMISKSAALRAEKRLQRGHTFRLGKAADADKDVELLALTDKEKQRMLQIVQRNKMHGSMEGSGYRAGPGLGICNLDFQGVKLLWLELNPGDDDELTHKSATQIFEKCEIPLDGIITSFELIQYFDSMKVAMDEAHKEHVLTLRDKIWIIVGSDRKPTLFLSRLSMVYTFIIQLAITISVLIIFIESMPSNMNHEGEVDRNPIRFAIEAACVGFFICDIILCWISYPKGMVAYLSSFWFWLEWIVVLPFLLQVTGLIGEENARVRSILSLKIFRIVVRLTKVLRVAKLGKRSAEVNIVVASLYEARHPIWCLVLISSMTIVVSGSLLFFAEHDEAHFDFNRQLWMRDADSTYPDAGQVLFFQSIPDTFWFHWVSLTTVGYGDVYPITPWGKVSGCLTMVSSVFVIGCPTTIMMSSFSQAYDRHLAKFAIKKQKERFIQRLRLEQKRAEEAARQLDLYKREVEQGTLLGNCSKFFVALDELEENMTVTTAKAAQVVKRQSLASCRASQDQSSLDHVAVQFQDMTKTEPDSEPQPVLLNARGLTKPIRVQT